MKRRVRASIVGGSGYAGGELLRLLLGHPGFELGQVTSERLAGSFVRFAHPNLRGRTALRFVAAGDLDPCDLLFLCLPHGRAAEAIERFAGLAERIVDLSGDFRLDDPESYRRWNGRDHPRPQWLGRFVYGLPELDRERIRTARYVSGVGCNAVAAALAVLPPVADGLVADERGIVCDLKVGSSEAGASPSTSGHHPERSGAVRSYAPTGHRHTGEVRRCLAAVAGGDAPEVHLSVTAVERVRGVLATCHLFLTEGVDEKEVWRSYRRRYDGEPFVRVVKERTGVYRYPEPKILSGTNLVEVGFELDPAGRRLVALAALDNLMKGAAGTALQCANLMHGIAETEGLDFPGLHPV